MTLWAILTAMIAIAAVLVSIPFVRRYERARINSSAAAAAVYRSQIEEIDREVTDGVIDPAQADSARTEIKRQLLAADASAQTSTSNLSSSERLFALVSIAGIVVFGSVAIYAVTGSPDLPSAPAPGLTAADAIEQLAALERPKTPVAPAAPVPDKPQSGVPSVDQMIDRLAARLKQSPQDPEGWRMLGWSYFRTDRFADAAAAYARAIEQNPANPELRGARIEALVKAAAGRVTAGTASDIEETLKLDPKNVQARFFLGLAREQAGDKRAALRLWTELLDGANPAEPWVRDLKERVAAVGRELGLSTPTTASGPVRDNGKTILETLQGGGRPVVGEKPERGPTADDVRNAESMAPADRMAMIRDMVDGLAKRLEKSPNDVDGWVKLMRSRNVLGEPQIAKQALERALAVFAEGTKEREQVQTEARRLGLLR
jgi:cytochrome c-type biogenesis protein CcmH